MPELELFTDEDGNIAEFDPAIVPSGMMKLKDFKLKCGENRFTFGAPGESEGSKDKKKAGEEAKNDAYKNLTELGFKVLEVVRKFKCPDECSKKTGVKKTTAKQIRENIKILRWNTERLEGTKEKEYYPEAFAEATFIYTCVPAVTVHVSKFRPYSIPD
jgi:hypothetical protein